MTALILACASFVLMHLLVSGTRLRGLIAGVIGEGAYMGLFSLASVAVLVWLCVAFGAARTDPANTVFWASTTATRTVQLVATLMAFLLIVPGLTTRNPTSVKQEGLLDTPDAIRGMVRITRHPFLWGVAIWAFGHLLVSGNLAGLLLFGSMLLLAVLGTSSIDAKRKLALGAAWDAFAARTSNLPFAAILSGRQTLKIGEIGAARVIAAVVVWLAVIWAHPLAFGVSPLPWSG